MADEIKQVDRVLEVKIDSLKELTDTKLKDLEKTLSRIELVTLNFVSKNELEEVKKDFNASVKRIEEGLLKRDADLVKHTYDDKESFASIDRGQREVRDTLLKWGGALGLALLALSFLSPAILHYFFKF